MASAASAGIGIGGPPARPGAVERGRAQHRVEPRGNVGRDQVAHLPVDLVQPFRGIEKPPAFLVDLGDWRGAYFAATLFAAVGLVVSIVFVRSFPDLRHRDAAPAPDTEPLAVTPS